MALIMARRMVEDEKAIAATQRHDKNGIGSPFVGLLRERKNSMGALCKSHLLGV
jgi:hypothetical protein